jgi:hypothetical protein
MKMKNNNNLLKTAIARSWSFIAYAAIVCTIITSCNSNENFLEPASKEASVSTSKKLTSGVMFTVSPSGNYNDDSYNIQEALDNAVAAGPGSTVKLTAGTFYLKERIEVAGFDGFFKGAGKEQTILTTHDKITFNLPWHQFPSLIKFRNGNITMSDMTIMITDPEPCIINNQNQSLPAVIVITGNDVNPGTEGQMAKFTFNKVKFVGGDGSTWGLNYNILQFILASWESDNSAVYPLAGGYKITNCEFKQAYICISTQYTEGPCIIGGDVTKGNIFKETEVAVAPFDIISSYCNASYNFFDRIHWIGVAAWQGVTDLYTLPLTDFILNGNNIKLNSYSPGGAEFTIGIYPVDYGIFAGYTSEPKINALISNNKIQIDDIGFAGILGQCNNNAIITNNIIWGTGVAGIVTGIWDDPVNSGWVIKGNNVQGVNAQEAPIWLGPSTTNFLVAGGSNKTNVLDQGTGNILTGVNIVRGSTPGMVIPDAMRKKYEMLTLLRQHGMK